MENIRKTYGKQLGASNTRAAIYPIWQDSGVRYQKAGIAGDMRRCLTGWLDIDMTEDRF
jgi:hypothetical protein